MFFVFSFYCSKLNQQLGCNGIGFHKCEKRLAKVTASAKSLCCSGNSCHDNKGHLIPIHLLPLFTDHRQLGHTWFPMFCQQQNLAINRANLLAMTCCLCLRKLFSHEALFTAVTCILVHDSISSSDR